MPYSRRILVNKDEIGLFLIERWLETVNTHDVLEVSFLYDMNNCILLPTVSNHIFLNEEIVNYFEIFLNKKNLHGVLLNRKVDMGGEVFDRPLLYTQLQEETLICSGVYVFSFEENGYTQRVKARFTFAFSYCEDCEELLIINHHSSMYPEEE